MAFECPKCRGDLYYNIKRGKLRCSHCDSEIAVGNYDLRAAVCEPANKAGVTAGNYDLRAAICKTPYSLSKNRKYTSA